MTERENEIALFKPFIDELSLEIADLKSERACLRKQHSQQKTRIEKVSASIELFEFCLVIIVLKTIIIRKLVFANSMFSTVLSIEP